MPQSHISEQTIKYPGTLAKQGISWHIKEFENYDKNFIRLPRQDGAKKYSEIHGGKEEHEGAGHSYFIYL